jgi:hypothetical protein
MRRMAGPWRTWPMVFTNALLDRLARDGLATIQSGTICTSTRRITVIWVAITEAGQRALADKRLVE